MFFWHNQPHKLSDLAILSTFFVSYIWYQLKLCKAMVFEFEEYSLKNSALHSRLLILARQTMGQKGDKSTENASVTAALFVEKLQSIAPISSKKMFGGHGIFFQGKMFGIVDSKGQCYFKVSNENRSDFEQHDARQHGRMPYFAIPEPIFNDTPSLLVWAKKAIAGITPQN